MMVQHVFTSLLILTNVNLAFGKELNILYDLDILNYNLLARNRHYLKELSCIVDLHYCTTYPCTYTTHVTANVSKKRYSTIRIFQQVLDESYTRPNRLGYSYNSFGLCSLESSLQSIYYPCAGQGRHRYGFKEGVQISDYGCDGEGS